MKRIGIAAFVAIFVGLLALTFSMRVNALELTPLPSTPPSGWCYAGTICTALRQCTYAGVQACPTQQPGPDYCGQVRNATVGFASGASYFADLARYENLLGKTSAQSIAQAFPAVSVSPYVVAFPKSGFIAAKFTVPATINSGAYGTIAVGETYAGGSRRVSMSLSPSCGFTVPVAAPNCALSGLGMNQGISWKVAGSATTGIRCALVPGASYFLNVKFDPTPPASDTYNCSATACKLPLVTSVQR